jgi:hypothetical protein
MRTILVHQPVPLDIDSCDTYCRHGRNRFPEP